MYERRGAPRGFTLIELLVVIGIISILAAMLFPVFAKARQAAQKSVCASNGRQWGMAFAMYGSDWEAYPHNSHHSIIPADQRPYVTDWTDAKAYRWEQMLRPYVGIGAILACPVADYDLGWPHTNAFHIGYNYQYLGNGRLLPQGRGTVRDSMIRNSAETIAFADSAGLIRNFETAQRGQSGYVIDPPFPSAEYPQYYGGTNPEDRAVPAPRHGNGLNITFVDGHAKWFRIEVIDEDNTYWDGLGVRD